MPKTQDQETPTKTPRTQWVVPSEAKVQVTVDVPTTFQVNGKSYDLASFKPEILTHLLIHGLGQKVGDAAAMTKADMAGKSAEAIQAEKWGYCVEAADKLANGDLSKSRGGGSIGLTLQSFTVEYALKQAVAKGKACTRAQAVVIAKEALMDPEKEAKMRVLFDKMVADMAAGDVDL